MDGGATALLGIGLLFWLDLGADRFFEPNRFIRGFLLFALIFMIGFVLWMRIFRRLMFKIRDEQLAMLLERFEPKLGESLITSVQLREKAEGIHPVLMQRTLDRALGIVPGISIHGMFKYGRLVLRIFCALLMLAGIIGFCAKFSETAEIWFSRNILISDRDWPRQARITIDGFDENGVARIARGDSFTLVIKADTTARRVPDSVRIRVASSNGGYRSILIDEFTTDIIEGIEYRVFIDTIPELLETASLNIQGADTRLNRTLEVVPPPSLSSLRIVYKYPEYMQREDRIEEKPTGRLNVPEGTTLVLEAKANKPLNRVSVTQNKETESLVKSAGNSAPFEEFTHKVTDLREDRLLEFTLEDSDAISNRQPIRLEIMISPDQTPYMDTFLDGIGSAITNIAVLPIQGRVNDDYGLVDITLKYIGIREKAPETIPAHGSDTPKDEEQARDIAGDSKIASLQGKISEYSLDTKFEIGPLELQSGDRLSLHIEANDAYNLVKPDAPPEQIEAAQKGQIGTGDRWQLDIVSPEKLRSLLEAKEIILRQRFEALIVDVQRTQEILTGIDLHQILSEEEKETSRKEAEAIAKKIDEDESLSPEQKQQKHEEAALEAEKKKLANRDSERINEKQAEDAEYNISRSLRDTQKEVFEHVGIATGFRNIRKELVNNRIYTPEVQDRIDNLIISPLESLINEDFPSLDEKLFELNRLLEERSITPCYRLLAQHDLVNADMVRILEKMNSIKESMVDMESFNEAIEILREIIRQQKTIRDETTEERKQQLRELLGD